MRLPALVVLAAAAAAGGAVLGAAGYAAIPTSPTQQRMREFNAVISSAVLYETFRPDVPTRIEFVRQNLYRVSGARCVLDLQLVWQPQPQGLVGPGTFEMQEAARRCD
jgi:hypothetical protein